MPSTSSFPPPWNNSGAAEYEHQHNIYPSAVDPRYDPEIAQLEGEAARIRKRRENLQEMQELEEREAEIRQSIVERKRTAGSPH